MLLCLGSCQVEELGVQQSQATNPEQIDQLKSWYEQNNRTTSSDNWLNGFTPNWQKVKRLESTKQYIYEIELNSEINVVIGTPGTSSEKSTKKKNAVRLLIFEDKDTKKTRACFMNIVDTENSNTDLSQIHYKKYRNFTGYVNFFETNGAFSNGWFIQQGKVTKSGKLSGAKDIEAITKRNSQTSRSVVCDFISVSFSRTWCVIVGGEEEDRTGFDNSYRNCTERWDAIVLPVYCEVPDIDTTDHSTDCGGEPCGEGEVPDYGGGGGYDPSEGGGTNVSELTIEDRINEINLDPCTKDILDKLKNLSQADINEMIKRFNPAGSIFDMDISIGKVKSLNNFAETTRTASSYYGVNMVLNEDYIYGKDNPARPTDLSIATTIVHEFIHAYLISLMGENLSCGSGGICDFPTIYDAYVTAQKEKNPYITNDAEHELIANKYVDVIAATIQEFHTGKAVELGKATQVYTDLAWAGLWETTYFNNKYPDDPNNVNYNDRERIKKRVHAEKIGSNFGEIELAGESCQ